MKLVIALIDVNGSQYLKTECDPRPARDLSLVTLLPTFLAVGDRNGTEDRRDEEATSE